MIPTTTVLTEAITEATYSDKTYKIVFNDVSPTDEGYVEEEDVDRLSGYVDETEALKQSIYLILSTERYSHLIYSWDYGVELFDLIGKPIPYVMSELPRRITEALLTDDRISDVTDFEFEKNGKQLHVTFTVITDVGNISTALEVTV